MPAATGGAIRWKLLFDYTYLGRAKALRRMGVEGFASGMPAFGGVLNEDEIRAILGFIEEGWPEDLRAIRAERGL